jgi:hypothetical protein
VAGDGGCGDQRAKKKNCGVMIRYDKRVAPRLPLRLCRNVENIVSVDFPVISTAGRNLRSLTFVRDDNAISGHCETVSCRERIPSPFPQVGEGMKPEIKSEQKIHISM